MTESSDSAAELLAMERRAFLDYAFWQGIAFFDMSAEEFADAVALAARLLNPA